MRRARLTEGAPSKRQADLLEAAALVFARFGYRKTSMDEVARAAGLSRQALYLRYANKEALFRATVAHVLARQLAGAVAALADKDRSLERRLIAAVDEMLGGYIGTANLDADAADLVPSSKAMTGALAAEHDARFEQAIADSLRAAKTLMSFYAARGLSARDLAQTLHATAQGLKLQRPSREAFLDGVTVAVRILCAPARAKKSA